MRRTAAVVVALVLLLPSVPEAHEIPADVTVQAFVHPADSVLHFLVRVPLVAMRDYEFPVRPPGYLQLTEALSPARRAAEQWIGDFVTFYAEGTPLPRPRLEAVRISIPGDGAFADFRRALEQVRGPPLPDDVDLPPQQAMLDALFAVPLPGAASELAVDARLAHLGLRTLTVLRVVLPDGSTRALQYKGDPGLVRLDPRWYHVVANFVALGFEHILDGIDHLLFLLCLVVPVRSFWALVPIVTSFTVAHSITLIASALGLAPDALWFPPLIETLIALSIVFMAFENILGARGAQRWAVAFGFGLVHGFGFSFALSEQLQFAGAHLLVSLLSFNVGVELGQLAVLAVLVPALTLLFRRVPETMGVIVLSAVLAHTGWHWMLDRGSGLLRYDVRAPALDLALAAALLRWAMLALIVLGAVWTLRAGVRWLERRHPTAWSLSE